MNDTIHLDYKREGMGARNPHKHARDFVMTEIDIDPKLFIEWLSKWEKPILRLKVMKDRRHNHFVVVDEFRYLTKAEQIQKYGGVTRRDKNKSNSGG